MASMLNALVKTVCEHLDNDEEVFQITEVLQWTYPGVPQGSGFVKDALRVWNSVMKKVAATRNVSLIPLTAYFFEDCGGVVPDIDLEARRCVSGVFGRMGAMVGFKVAGHDALTPLLLERDNKTAEGQVTSVLRTRGQVSSQLGLTSQREALEGALLLPSPNDESSVDGTGRPVGNPPTVL